MWHKAYPGKPPIMGEPHTVAVGVPHTNAMGVPHAVAMGVPHTVAMATAAQLWQSNVHRPTSVVHSPEAYAGPPAWYIAQRHMLDRQRGS